MPGEFEPHKQIWMLWPQRPDNWRLGAKPAQRSWVDVATAISRFEPITVGVNHDQYENAVDLLPAAVRVIELSSNDAWMRDCGPTFVVNDKGDVRLVDWDFNAWGGLHDGLYFPWEKDQLVPQKIAQLEGVDRYKAHLVMEGGSFHVDGEGLEERDGRRHVHPGALGGLGAEAPVVGALRPEHPDLLVGLELPRHAEAVRPGGAVDELAHEGLLAAGAAVSRRRRAAARW
jgi:agmatine deiminase